jgi:GT2 family glycosyltransferase
VVVESVRGVDTLARTLRSVVDQVDVRLEIVVVTDGLVPDLDTRLAPLPDHVSLVVVRHEGSRASTGLNLALEQLTGDLVAFVAAGESWEPGRLRRLAAACRDGRGVAYDSMLVHRPEKPPVYAAATLPSGTPPVVIATVELTRLVLAREVLEEHGGFDETLRGGWEADFTFRLLSRHEATHVTAVGVERDVEVVAEARRLDPPEQPVPDHSTVPTWSDVAFNRYAIDWERLERRPAGPDVISVVIPTHDDWRMTRGSVLTVLASDVPAGMSLECVILDNGSDAATAQMLDSLAARHEGVRVVHAPTNFGYAVGNNLAVGEVSGDTVVFLNNDTKVDPGWLRPLVSQLADPGVQAVQSLLLYPSGTIQSAGVVFPDCGGVPYAFLAGFPVEDAAGLERESFSALTGASLAMRFQDVVALRGFDPLFRNGMEDVDLCLRLARLRPGRCVVEPASRVTHLESRTAGRFDKVVMNRRLFLDRWDESAPRDDSAIWVGRGFDVVDHVVRTVISEDRRLCTPEPVLVRSRALVTQHPPRLRWALKNPATQGPWGDAWGDTHFARCLATALRELGQDVVTDRGSEFYRSTGYLDDVVLTLRGRTEFQPSYGQVNLAWVISHPEMLSWQEATSYDRVLAASESWSKKMSERWGMHIDPLMQATDPVLFHPDRAVADSGPEVLFVGNSRGKRRPMVEDAMAAGLPLSVYGTCWEEFLPPGVLRGEFVPNTDLGAMYASAGVVLNDHWDDMRADGFLSNRLFDAAASGARVVTDDVTGLNHLFGSSVQVARDATELAALVNAPDRDEIFGSLDERRRVAALVHREHSFLTRARVLLDAALSVRAEQDRRR